MIYDTGVRHPENCGQSIKKGSVFICLLYCEPCPIAWKKGKECAKDRINNFMLSMAGIVNEGGEDRSD